PREKRGFPNGCAVPVYATAAFAGSAAIVSPMAFPMIQVAPPSLLRQTCPSSMAQVMAAFAASAEIDPVPGSAAVSDHARSPSLRLYTLGCAAAYNVGPTSVMALMFGGMGMKPSLVMVHVLPPSSLRPDPPTLLCR